MAEKEKMIKVVEPAKVPVPMPEPEPKKVDNPTLVMLYVMYKSNLIGNHNLKQMLDVIGKPFPDDVAAYLVKEAAKAA